MTHTGNLSLIGCNTLQSRSPWLCDYMMLFNCFILMRGVLTPPTCLGRPSSSTRAPRLDMVTWDRWHCRRCYVRVATANSLRQAACKRHSSPTCSHRPSVGMLLPLLWVLYLRMFLCTHFIWKERCQNYNKITSNTLHKSKNDIEFWWKLLPHDII